MIPDSQTPTAPPKMPKGPTPWTASETLALFLWAASLVVLTFWPFGAPDSQSHLRAAGTLAAVFGAWCFWSHGERQITAAGLFGLASSAFVGYAALWWSSNLNDIASPITQATVLAYGAHGVMHFGFWRTTSPFFSNASLQGAPKNRQVSTWALTSGTLLTLAAFAIGPTIPSLAFAASAIGFTGIVLLTVGSVTRPSNAGSTVWRATVSGSLVALFILYIFNGYGRLAVAALLASLAVLFATYLHNRTMKFMSLAVLPIAIAILTQLRAAAVTSRFGAGSYDASAPDSTVTPLETFARILENDSLHNQGVRETLFASATVWIPRRFWEGKPGGFGNALAQLFSPGQGADGGTGAALTYGEWVYSFGMVGLGAMVLTLGLTIRWLDGLLASTLRTGAATRQSLILLSIATIATTGVLDLVWGGTGTVASRTGFRIIPLIGILALYATIFRAPAARGPGRA